MLRADRTRAERRRREREVLAYNTAICTVSMLGAALGGSPLPEFAEIFDAPRDASPMSDQQLAAQITALNAALGGTDTTTKG